MEPAQDQLYRLHVGLGLVVLLLTAFRLVWLLRHPSPDSPPNLSPLRERAFKWNHVLLYVLLVVLLASGVAMLLLSDLGLSPGAVTAEAIQDVPPRTAHDIASKVFLALLLMHVAGVVNYQLKKGDTFWRMGVKWRRR